MLDQCWASVVDARPTLAQHWVGVSYTSRDYSSSRAVTSSARDTGPVPGQCWTNVPDVGGVMERPVSRILPAGRGVMDHPTQRDNVPPILVGATGGLHPSGLY